MYPNLHFQHTQYVRYFHKIHFLNHRYLSLISQYCNKKIKLKSPNDILINKKKICGILQETIQKNNIQYLIVGIGLNLVNSPQIKNYPTTNLYDLTNSKISVSKISKELKYMYKNFLKSHIGF